MFKVTGSREEKFTPPPFSIKEFLDLLDLDSLQSYGLAVDMKVQLILVGKQSAAAKHACPFCECHSMYDCNCPSYTLGSLQQLDY